MSHEQFQGTIDALQECAIECIHCADSCLEEQDVKLLARCIKLNYECAEVCSFAARMLAGGSEFHKEVCDIAANICETCAAECKKHSQMEHCRACAEVCNDCADECRSMVKQRVM